MQNNEAPFLIEKQSVFSNFSVFPLNYYWKKFLNLHLWQIHVIY